MQRDSMRWTPKPPRAPHQPGTAEPLWTLCGEHHTWSAELRDHTDGSVEALLLRDGQFVIGRRFNTKAEAILWAGGERDDLSSSGSRGGRRDD